MAEWWEHYFSEVYSLTSFAKSGAAPRDVAFILARCPISPGSTILDMCCGDGRHALELGKRGWTVEGVDYSSTLVDKAERSRSAANLDRVSFRRGNVLDLSARGRYQLVLCWDESLGFFESDDDNDRALLNLCTSVATGGYICLQLHNYDGCLTPSESSMRLPGGIQIMDSRYMDRERRRLRITRVVTRGGTGERRKYDQSVRVWSPAELSDALSKYGFVDLQTFGGVDGSDASDRSENFILVAKRGTDPPPSVLQCNVPPTSQSSSPQGES